MGEGSVSLAEPVSPTTRSYSATLPSSLSLPLPLLLGAARRRSPRLRGRAAVGRRRRRWLSRRTPWVGPLRRHQPGSPASADLYRSTDHSKAARVIGTFQWHVLQRQSLLVLPTVVYMERQGYCRQATKTTQGDPLTNLSKFVQYREMMVVEG